MFEPGLQISQPRPNMSVAYLCLCLFHLLLQAGNLLVIHAKLAHVLLVPQMLFLVALLPLLRLILTLSEAVCQMTVLFLLKKQAALDLRVFGRLCVQLNNNKTQQFRSIQFKTKQNQTGS